MLYKLLFIKIEKMYVHLLGACFHEPLYRPNLLRHCQIWYHLIDNFMCTNFGKSILCIFPLVFKKKQKKEM